MLDKFNFLERLGILVVQGFLDLRLCQQILAEAHRSKEFRPARINKSKEMFTVQEVDTTIRKVQVIKMSKSTVQSVEQRLKMIRLQLEARFQVKLVNLERPILLFYREGDFFLPHRDRIFTEGHHIIQRREVSIVIFINGGEQTEETDIIETETYTGGELAFYLLQDEQGHPFGLPLKAKPGLLVAFDSAVMHEVKPVTLGNRLTIVSWFLGEAEIEKGKTDDE
jgi:SM-20-related protein